LVEGVFEATFTIDHLDEEIVVFEEVKDVLSFKETGQQLQLNQTTSEWLLDNLGDDPEKWPGEKVTLYVAPYKYKNETKLGVRIKRPGETIKPADTPQADTKTATPRSANRKNDMDDEIPF
jgi:hypothetical protein